jgi:hypothetical protein
MRLYNNAQGSIGIGAFSYYKFLGRLLALERNQLTSSLSRNPEAVNSVIGLNVTPPPPPLIKIYVLTLNFRE